MDQLLRRFVVCKGIGAFLSTESLKIPCRSKDLQSPEEVQAKLMTSTTMEAVEFLLTIRLSASTIASLWIMSLRLPAAEYCSRNTDFRLTNSIVCHNQSLTSSGGGVATVDAAGGTITRTAIAGNTAALNGGGVSSGAERRNITVVILS